MWIRGVALTLAVLAACTAGKAAAAAEEDRVIHKETLPNGLTVVIRENHSSPVVAVQVWVKSGSATEPERAAGMSHILEHMAFKGTKKRGPGQIARDVEALGGEINAYTSFDQTVYHITISGRYLDQALDILADTMANSVFDPGELAREKEVVLEELRMNEDDPGRVASKALFREAYRVHPYGRPVIGSADTIRETTREDILAYFRDHYHPGNMALVIAGDVDPRSARPLIARTFGRLESRPASRGNTPPEPRQEKTRVKIQEREARRAYLDAGFHGPSMRDDDVFAWDLLAMILGEGQTSRLYREVKDGQGLVDSVSASSYTPKDPGLLLIGATGASDKAREALREILVQTFRMAVAPPEGKELARAKAATEADFVYSLESQGSLARHVGFFETTLGDPAFEHKYIEKIRAVRAEDIAAVAKKYLIPANLSVAAVFPKGEGGQLPAAEVLKVVEEAHREATGAEKTPAAETAVAREILENGIRVIVREDRTVPVVSVEAGFLAGQRGEPADQGGVAAVTAEMLTKGTRSRSARQIAEAVEDMAAELWGFSGRNSFGLRGRFLRRDFDRGFGLFAESLRAPTFPAEELGKKRREILGRLKSQKDDLAQSAFLLFMAAHYDGHPYARNPLGTEESIGALTPASLESYYGRWADPRNMVIAISGDIAVQDALAAVRNAFGDFPRRAGYVPIGPIPVPADKGIRKAEERRSKEQAHFVIGYTGSRFTDPDRYAMDVLGSALAGQGGRLFTNLRDKKSLAYSVTSFSSEQVDPGFFAFYMGTSRDKLDGAIRDTLGEIEEVRRNGISPEDFERAKKWMIGTYEIGLQSNVAYAERMLFNELYGPGYEETFRTPQKIQAVTLEEVNRLAARLLSTERYSIAVIAGNAADKGTGGAAAVVK